MGVLTKKISIDFYKVSISFCLCILIVIFFLQHVRADDSMKRKTFLSSARQQLPLDCLTSSINEIEEPCSKVEALIAVFKNHLYFKDYPKAQYVLERAVKITDNIKNPFSKAIILTDIVSQYLKLKKPDRALGVAEKIELQNCRGDALVKIVNTYLQLAQYEKALLIAKGITDPFSEALAFYDLINHFITSGLYEHASETKEYIEKSEDLRTLIRILAARKGDDKKKEGVFVNDFIILCRPLVRSRILVRMAEKAFLSNSFTRAEKLLSEAFLVAGHIGSYFMKSDAQARIAICHIKMGNFEKAGEIIESISYVPARSGPLAEMAIAYAELKDYKTALSIAREIESEFFKEKAISYLIKKYLDTGKEKKAFEIINLLKGKFSKARLYAGIISQYAQRGEYKKAIRTVRLIKSRLIRIKCMSKLAKDIQKQESAPEDIKKIYCAETPEIIRNED